MSEFSIRSVNSRSSRQVWCVWSSRGLCRHYPPDYIIRTAYSSIVYASTIYVLWSAVLMLTHLSHQRLHTKRSTCLVQEKDQVSLIGSICCVLVIIARQQGRSKDIMETRLWDTVECMTVSINSHPESYIILAVEVAMC